MELRRDLRGGEQGSKNGRKELERGMEFKKDLRGDEHGRE